MLDNLKRLAERLPLPKIAMPESVRRLTSAIEPRLRQLRRTIDPAWASATAWYEKREQREKFLLQILGGILGIVLIYSLVYSPIVALSGDLSDRVATRRQDLIDVRAMMRNYDRLRASLIASEKRTVPGKNFSLFSALEQSLTNSVGREKIGSISPADHPVPGGFTQYTVDVKLTSISLAQIVDTLYAIQSLSVPITVSNLQIHEHELNARSYDVDLSCIALGRDG
jgi:type II secretion system (T2SS) protein M